MAFMENHQCQFYWSPAMAHGVRRVTPYIKSILSQLKKPPRTGVHITGLRRPSGDVMLAIMVVRWYDRVVIAAHAVNLWR